MPENDFTSEIDAKPPRRQHERVILTPSQPTTLEDIQRRAVASGHRAPALPLIPESPTIHVDFHPVEVNGESSGEIHMPTPVKAGDIPTEFSASEAEPLKNSEPEEFVIWPKKVIGDKVVTINPKTGEIGTVGQRINGGSYGSRSFRPENPEDQELIAKLDEAEDYDPKKPEHQVLTDYSNKTAEDMNVKIEIVDREHIVTDAETGEEIRKMPVIEGAADIPTNYNEAQLRGYIDGVIETYESNYPALLKNPKLIEDVVTELEDYPGRRITGDLVALRKELTEKVESRLYLTLLFGQATFGQGEQFAGTIGNWGRSGLEYIAFKLEAKEGIRVKNVVSQLENNEGGYFRVPTATDQKNIETNIVNQEKLYLIANAAAFGIIAPPMPPPPAGALPYTPAEIAAYEVAEIEKIAEKKANLALSLGKNLMVVTGQASFWGGAVNQNTGRLRELEIIETMENNGVAGFQNGEVDMQSDEYWAEWDRIRRQEGITIIRSILPNQRVAGNIGHTNPSLFKNSFFAPEVLEEARVGRVTSLRYLAETRARSLVFYKHTRTLSDYLNTLDPQWGPDLLNPGKIKAAVPDNIQNIGETEFGRWGRIVKGGTDFLGQFRNKEPYFLVSPMKHPNIAVQDPDKVAETMEPFTKLGQTLEYLAEYAPPGYVGINGPIELEPFKAREEKLIGLMHFMTTNDAQERAERRALKYTSWNDNLKSAAVDEMATIGLIREDEYNDLLERLHYNIFLAMNENGIRELGEKTVSGFVGLLKLITRA